MPIYMDRHILPGISAKDAAEAHRMDLVIQDEFGCRCMTYWVDEERGSAFCLIDAPSKEAVIKMHDHSHGLIPHQIIEVNSKAVMSFLGRIEDPEVTDLTDNSHIFKEPVFRTVLLLQFLDPLLLQLKMGQDPANKLLASFREQVSDLLELHQGQLIEQESEEMLCGFISTTKAVNCALKIQERLSSLNNFQHAQLKMTINAGIPVEHSETLFGDTIHLAKRMMFVASDKQIVAAPIINNLYKVNRQNHRIKVLAPADEEFLTRLMDTLEKYWAEPELNVMKFCEAMSMSKSACYRKMVKLTGQSPNNLVREFRLQKSLILLKKRNRNISQTSFDAGFSSPSYFTKCFQQRYDIRPQELLQILD